MLSICCGAQRVSLIPCICKRSWRTATCLSITSPLKKATNLLASGKSLVESALATGFSDQSHFQKAFKKKFGISPGQYKW
ncbi:helix-turn-helix domain-containing protein [Sporomusa acidovorans]|uniref:helix-turn-helix domain-containing protein n=1 Tax=Sporomusa acidovorans TaxID=112900 RepID=UPI00146F6961